MSNSKTPSTGNQSLSGEADASAISSNGANPTPVSDPIREGARIVAGDDYEALEHRLKSDIFASLCRIKPELKQHDFDAEIMQGTLLPTLPAPLQGVAIARVEGTLAFYNRVGWHPNFLDTPLDTCVSDEKGRDTLATKYHARTLHDLAYVHPKHFEKIFDKVGAAELWEQLKRYSSALGQG